MPAGLERLEHIVVLMMKNHSFDHRLGLLRAQDPRINGSGFDQPPLRLNSKRSSCFTGHLMRASVRGVSARATVVMTVEKLSQSL